MLKNVTWSKTSSMRKLTRGEILSSIFMHMRNDRSNLAPNKVLVVSMAAWISAVWRLFVTSLSSFLLIDFTIFSDNWQIIHIFLGWNVTSFHCNSFHMQDHCSSLFVLLYLYIFFFSFHLSKWHNLRCV
jgi:hypothetical protein